MSEVTCITMQDRRKRPMKSSKGWNFQHWESKLLKEDPSYCKSIAAAKALHQVLCTKTHLLPKSLGLGYSKSTVAGSHSIKK